MVNSIKFRIPLSFNYIIADCNQETGLKKEHHKQYFDRNKKSCIDSIYNQINTEISQ